MQAKGRKGPQDHWPEWVKNKNRVVGLAEDLIKTEDGLFEMFQERVRYLKKQWRVDHGKPATKSTRIEIYWEVMWQWIDAVLSERDIETDKAQERAELLEDGEKAPPEPEPEPEPEPKRDQVEEVQSIVKRFGIDIERVKKNKCSYFDAIQWAVEHSCVDLEDMDFYEAPSLAALSIYIWSKANPITMNTMMTQLLTKTMPKTKDEGSEGLTDDGGVIGLLDRLDAAAKEASDG